MSIKDRRTKILISLILLSDVNLTYVKFDNTLQKTFDLSLNQKTKGTLSGLLREELIEKASSSSDNPDIISTVNQDLSHSTPLHQEKIDPLQTTNIYRLTEKGFLSLCLKFPFFRFLRNKWDLKWRILSYEIPEKKREIRDRLRREVSGWGLGPWHRSFWLTPHPIIENLRDLVNQKEEEQYIQAFESEHRVGNRDILIEKVWQKENLDKKYRGLFKVWHETLSTNEDKLTKFKTVVNEYVEILKLDPGLPEELVGKNWIGFEAFNIYKEIRSILLS